MPSHRASQDRARRRLPLALAAAAVLAAASATAPLVLAGGAHRTGTTAGDSGGPACRTARHAAACADREHGSARPAATTAGRGGRRRPAGRPASRRAGQGRTPRSSTAPPASTAAATVAASVLAVINQARVRAGLAPYAISGGLVLSATRHTAAMAGGCGLSHQCPGEQSLGSRETAAGVRWTEAGENIGEGGPVSGGTASVRRMAVALTRAMLSEKPPGDGHRLNLLSSGFTSIGIAVYLDGQGTVWMTQDFSG